MIGRFLAHRRLEHSFALSTSLLVVLVIGATTLVVHSRVLSALKRGLTDRGRAIAERPGVAIRRHADEFKLRELHAAGRGFTR